MGRGGAEPARPPVAVSRGSARSSLRCCVAQTLWPGSSPGSTNPLRLGRAFATVVPRPEPRGLADWSRLSPVTSVVERGTLILERADRARRGSLSLVRRLVSWMIPLPAGGVSLQLVSGRWFPWDCSSPTRWRSAGALAAAGGSAERSPRRGHAGGALRHVDDERALGIDLPRSNSSSSRCCRRSALSAAPVGRLRRDVRRVLHVRARSVPARLRDLSGPPRSCILVLFAAVLRALPSSPSWPSSTAWRAPGRTLAVRRTVEAAFACSSTARVLGFLSRLYLQSRGRLKPAAEPEQRRRRRNHRPRRRRGRSSQRASPRVLRRYFDEPEECVRRSAVVELEDELVALVRVVLRRLPVVDVSLRTASYRSWVLPAV